MSTESLTTPNDKDLARLRQGRRGRYSIALIKGAAAFFSLLVFAFVILYAVHQYQGDYTDLDSSLNDLSRVGATWTNAMFEDVSEYRDWLDRHGTLTEAAIFDSIAHTLVVSAVSVADHSGGGDLPFLGSLYIALHFGLLRMLFFVVACLRLWIVAVVGSAVWGARTFRYHVGNDILGQTSNGRLFYSGVKADLSKLAADGAPDILIRGLACLKSAPSSEIKSSNIYRVLESFNALNATNESLVGIIIAHKESCPYVAAVEEEGMLAEFFCGGGLLVNAENLLQSILSVHAHYAAGELSDAPLEDPQPDLENGADSEKYSLLIKHALHRVLNSGNRADLGGVPAAEIATVALAIEAGKTLAYSYEGGKWTRKSNFLQLSARSALHSVAAFSSDYSYESRNFIRRAIIYGLRRSSFAPVHMPVDLSPETWSMRQWAELLLAMPHELEAIADEVELVGMIRTAHHGWVREFLDSGIVLTPEISRTGYTAQSSLLFMPIRTVVSILNHTIERDQFERLEELVDVVSNRQRLHMLAAQASDSSPNEFLLYERIPSLIPEEEIDKLSQMHGLTQEEVRLWSALRVVLNYYGWLARRVGDYTVPDSSVIFSVFKMPPGSTSGNELGFMSLPGMVAFRGSRLEERWGKRWTERFVQTERGIMAETPEDVEKLLKGIEPKDASEDIERFAPSIGS